MSYRVTQDTDKPQARQSAELKVFISQRDSACDECHEELGRRRGYFWPEISRRCAWRALIWITWSSCHQAIQRLLVAPRNTRASRQSC
jgi:hypothetical protein